MHAPKAVDLEAEQPADRLYRVVLGLVQQGKYELIGVSNEKQTLLFTRGKSAFSWGQQHVAEVSALPGGRSLLHLVCGDYEEAPHALMDGVKNKRIATKFITQVAAATADPGHRAQPVQSFIMCQDGSTAPWDGTIPV